MVASDGRLRIEEAEASAARACGDAIGRLLDRQLGALILRDAFPPERLTAFVDAAERGAVELPVVRPPNLRGRVLGRPLVAAERDDLADYLDDAERFRAGCARWFEPPLERRLMDLLSKIAGGRAVSVARAGDGRSYVPATVRVLSDGDALPLHYENSTFERPPMRALLPRLDRRSLLSFYVPMVQPDAGGELRHYAVDCLDGGDSILARRGEGEDTRAWFREQGMVTLLPAVGDLLLFDGGRHYHEVTCVRGRARWTLGGFLAASLDGAEVWFWS